MKLYETGAYLINGRDVVIDSPEAALAVESKTGKAVNKKEAAEKTGAADAEAGQNGAYCRLHEGHGDAGKDSAARKVCPDACGANEDAAGKNGAKAAARQFALRFARGRGAARGWIPWTESRQQDRPGGCDLRGIRPARDGGADAQCIDHEGNTRRAGFAARGKGETIWQMNRCAC